MIPEGWANVTLAEISDPRASIRYGVVQIGANTPGGVPIVPIKYIDQIGKVPLHLASPEIEGKYKNSRVQAGDVLISVKGTIGEVGIVPSGFSGNIAREIARIRPNGKANAEYIAYQLQAPQTQRRIKSVTVGTTRLEFSIAAVKSFEIALPPLGEQRGIVAALETWDRAIETVEALIANARAQKQALMQQLLPQGTTLPERRLPGFSGEWREAKLGSLADISKGEQKGRASLAEEGPVPVINGGITPSGYTDHPNTSADTITISEGGNSCGYVDLITQPFWCGGHCYALKNLKVERDYLFAVLKHRERQIMSLRVGSGLPNIQKKALSQFSIPVPPKSEQVKIGELAACAGKEIAGHQSQLFALRQEKTALMQQLLTGKRRVNLPESEVTHA